MGGEIHKKYLFKQKEFICLKKISDNGTQFLYYFFLLIYMYLYNER